MQVRLPWGGSAWTPPTNINYYGKGVLVQSYYKPDALPVAQPTASYHWRQMTPSSENNVIVSALHPKYTAHSMVYHAVAKTACHVAGIQWCDVIRIAKYAVTCPACAYATSVCCMHNFLQNVIVNQCHRLWSQSCRQMDWTHRHAWFYYTLHWTDCGVLWMVCCSGYCT